MKIYKLSKEFPEEEKGFVSGEECEVLGSEAKKVGKLINGLIKSIEKQI